MLKQLFNTLVSPKGRGVVPLRHQSEEKLHTSELRYRRLFETAQDGILILDAHTGKITDANPFLKDLLGYSDAELVGKELWEIGVFKDIVDSKIAFVELQTKGYIRYVDLPLKTKEGRSIDVEFISNVYMVDTERVIQCNIRDITNRKKAEEAIEARTKELEDLTQSQEESKKAMLNVMEDLEQAKKVIEVEKVKDEAILASIGEGLIAVDNDRKVIIINKVAEKMLGRKMKDVMGKEITDLPLEDEEGHLLPLNKRPTYVALTTGENVTTTYFFVRKDKTRFPIAINVTPIKLGDKIIGTLNIFRDITREREIDKAKTEFVSLASHQLRTPLGIIKWYLEALAKEDYFNKSPKLVRGYFNEIYKGNERVLSLVRDLLSVSRIDQGRVKNVPKSINVVQVITEIVEQMQIVAHKKKVALDLTIKDQKIPSITIDILRLHEVIENLISNAIEYSKASGKVNVTVSKSDNLLLISVKDTGIGITPADQKKLFTKFFRTEMAIGYNPEGSGLGLYVVKSYVDGWGGKISVKSADGKGSIFTITLPIVQKTPIKRKLVKKRS